MKQNDWKNRLGVMYSTNPDYKYQMDEEAKEETLPKEKQRLHITLEKRNRGDKIVTLVSGFRGTGNDRSALGKWLKTRCGVGGSVKDGEIIIQGDWRRKVTDLLTEEGYHVC